MQLPDPEILVDELASQMRRGITPETALVGIHTGGVWLAERLHNVLGLNQPLGTIDISSRDAASSSSMTSCTPGVRSAPP